MSSRRGFTLIELLVVIAIIAILSAALMPALSSSLDRARVTECRSNLTHLAMALRMYYGDNAAYPATVEALGAAGLVSDDALLRCPRTGEYYYYVPPPPGAPLDSTLAACADPATPPGQRPHGFRQSLLVLEKSGKIGERGR
ncbi:MAG TPA: prepilin-type N-terminal cleavage/methylation domain-containing protein [Armatimonadota bacterium]